MTIKKTKENTGLKNIDNKDIYVGDIMRYTHHRSLYNCNDNLWYIEKDDKGNFIATTKQGSITYAKNLAGGIRDCSGGFEILGSIFDNPKISIEKLEELKDSVGIEESDEIEKITKQIIILANDNRNKN